MPTERDTLQKIIKRIRICPTCMRPLRLEGSGSQLFLKCPDLFDGKFTLTFVNGGWLIEYHLKAQVLL